MFHFLFFKISSFSLSSFLYLPFLNPYFLYLLIYCLPLASPGGVPGVSGLNRFTSSTVGGAPAPGTGVSGADSINISPGLLTSGRRSSRSQEAAGM